MTGTNDSAFGGYWDLSEDVAEQLISYPISQMIRQSAAQAGIDLDNPVRSIVSLMSSGMLGFLWGSFLGPFGAILGGLMGETLGLAASYPGDRTREERRIQGEVLLMLRVKAMTTALEILRDHVTQETWNAISADYQRRLRSLGNMQGTKEEAVNIGINMIIQGIQSTDWNVYRNFDAVYRAVRRELRV